MNPKAMVNSIGLAHVKLNIPYLYPNLNPEFYINKTQLYNRKQPSFI